MTASNALGGEGRHMHQTAGQQTACISHTHKCSSQQMRSSQYGEGVLAATPGPGAEGQALTSLLWLSYLGSLG